MDILRSGIFSPPSSQKRRSRMFISSPMSSGRRRSVRLSVSKPVSTSNVKVCIRVRPLSEKEWSFKDGKTVIEIMDDNVLVFDPVQMTTPSFHRGFATRDPTARRCRDLKFGFGRVFGPGATNEDIFEETTGLTLNTLMKGINCSVFAYGATGAGKTFTMLGSPTNKGVIARTVHKLYEHIESIKDNIICDIEVSYLEIYNETVRDLLNPTGRELFIRESKGSFVVSGLSFHKPLGVEDLFQMLETGNANRTQHPTDANKESSRSHAVFHIYLKQRDRTSDLKTDIVMSKMALIDLAGSERASATANCGKRFQEGAKINRSLLALGNCINALAEGKIGNHIPYRDSKLTRILKDSLGGNCQTVMIAAISPSSMAYDDTYNTLKYADRAQKIKVDLKSNVYRLDHHVHQYGKIVEDLQTEVLALREKVHILEKEKKHLKMQVGKKRSATSPVNFKHTQRPSAASQTDPQFSDYIKAMTSYTNVQGQVLKLESQRRILKLKMCQREKSNNQLNDVKSDEAKKDVANSRWTKLRSTWTNRIAELDSEIDGAIKDLDQMREDLVNIMKRYGSVQCANGDQPGVERHLINGIFAKSKLFQLQASDDHWKQIVNCLTFRLNQRDSIIDSMTVQLKDQYLLLKSYGHLTKASMNRYESIEKMIEGRSVRFMDQCENSDDTETAVFAELCSLPDYSVYTTGSGDNHIFVPGISSAHSSNQVDVGMESSDDTSTIPSTKVHCFPDLVDADNVSTPVPPKKPLVMSQRSPSVPKHGLFPNRTRRLASSASMKNLTKWRY